MKLGIVIHATTNWGGVYQYSLALSKALLNKYSDLHIFAFHKNVSAIKNAISEEANVILLNSSKDFIQTKVDLLFYPTAMSLSYKSGVPYIVSIHDIQHKIHPEFPEVSLGKEAKDRELRFTNCIKYASGILASNEVGKNEIIVYYKDFLEPNKKLFVLPYTPLFQNLKNDHTDFQDLKKKYKIPDQFIFYPAQFWLHKNHSRIIHAIHILKYEYRIKMPVVFVGSTSGREHEGREYVLNNARSLSHTLGVDDLVYILGYVADNFLPILYQHAQALIMPSFFGPSNIPIFEAWELGCPVVASNIPGMRDDIGNAGLLIDPYDANSIALAIMNVISPTPERSILIENGFIRAKTHSFQYFSKRIYSILSELGIT